MSLKLKNQCRSLGDWSNAKSSVVENYLPLEGTGIQVLKSDRKSHSCPGYYQIHEVIRPICVLPSHPKTQMAHWRSLLGGLKKTKNKKSSQLYE